MFLTFVAIPYVLSLIGGH